MYYHLRGIYVVSSKNRRPIMPAKKITINSVKALKPNQTIWDTETKGFGCRRQKGEDKVFVLKYRFGKGRTARQYLYTIGKLGSPWTPDTARGEAKKILGKVANGENPAAERKNRKEANSVDEAFDLFIEDSQGKRAERTIAEYRRLYDKLAKAQLKRYRVEDVTHADIQKLHSGLSRTPPQANRLLQMLSAFFNWCEKNGHRPKHSSPCRDIEKYSEHYRERFLSEKELFALSDAITRYEREYGYLKEKSHKKNKADQGEVNVVTPYVTAAIRLLIFTGARRSEIVTLKWEAVDFQKRLIRLQTSKTGQKTIYLSAPALQILSEIPRVEDNPYVICGAKESSHLVNIKDTWGRIRKMATLDLWRENERLDALVHDAQKALPEDCRIDDLFKSVRALAKINKVILPVGVTDVRLHDLRHNFASTAVTSGHHLKVIGSLLGHANTKTTERYAHLADDPLQTASEVISERLLNVMTRSNNNNVVHI